jgi:hypothetical protein
VADSFLRCFRLGYVLLFCDCAQGQMSHIRAVEILLSASGSIKQTRGRHRVPRLRASVRCALGCTPLGMTVIGLKRRGAVSSNGFSRRS